MPVPSHAESNHNGCINFYENGRPSPRHWVYYPLLLSKTYFTMAHMVISCLYLMDLYLITTTIHMSLLSHEYPPKNIYLIWLVVSTPLKYMSQLGLLFPIYGKS